MWDREPPFQMIRGARLPYGVYLAETWSRSEGKIAANISAEHIAPLFDAFLALCEPEEPLFLFLEAPCEMEEEEDPELCTHKNVYYLDGCGRGQLRELLHSSAGELLIHDGMSAFGFGSLRSCLELGKYKYNQVLGYASPERMERLAGIFASLEIPQVPEILSAWDLFTPKTPGLSEAIQVEGKDIYDLIRQLRELGLYLAEQKED